MKKKSFSEKEIKQRKQVVLSLFKEEEIPYDSWLGKTDFKLDLFIEQSMDLSEENLVQLIEYSKLNGSIGDVFACKGISC